MKDFRDMKTLEILLTSDCNLQCKFCYNIESNKRNHLNLSLDNINNILIKAKNFGVGNIILAGGEPLIRKDIKEIINNILNQGMYVTIYTNGTLINDELISFFKEKRYFIDIRVSIDGIKKNNDFVRGLGVFDKVIETAKKLVANNIKTGLGITINEYNIKDIKDIFKLAISLKCDYFKFAPLFKYGNGESSKFSRKNYQDTLKNIFYNLITYKKFIDFDKTKSYYASLPLEKLFGRCPAGEKYFAIESNGLMYACPLISEIEEIKDISIYEDNSFEKMFQKIDFLKKTNKNIGDCKNCKLLPDCSGKCLAIKSNKQENYFSCSNELLIEIKNIFKKLKNEEINFLKMYWINLLQEKQIYCLKYLPIWHIKLIKERTYNI